LYNYNSQYNYDYSFIQTRQMERKFRQIQYLTMKAQALRQKATLLRQEADFRDQKFNKKYYNSEKITSLEQVKEYYNMLEETHILRQEAMILRQEADQLDQQAALLEKQKLLSLEQIGVTYPSATIRNAVLFGEDESGKANATRVAAAQARADASTVSAIPGPGAKVEVALPANSLIKAIQNLSAKLGNLDSTLNPNKKKPVMTKNMEASFASQYAS